MKPTPLDPDRKTGIYFLIFSVAACLFAFYAPAQVFRFAAIGPLFVSLLWGLALLFDGVTKPIDQDRKNGIYLIMVTLASWTIAANTQTEWYRIPCMFIGLVTFMWVTTLMGKSVDKHGWGDGTGRDDDEKKN